MAAGVFFAGIDLPWQRRLAAPVRLRFRFAQAPPDTLCPNGLRAAAPRVAPLGRSVVGGDGLEPPTFCV